MSIWIKLPFFIFEYAAAIIFTLSAFRLPIKFYLHKILLIALSMSFVFIYIRDFLHQTSFALIPTLIIEIILIMIFFRLPLIFSFFVGIIGLLGVGTVELTVLWLETNFNVFTFEQTRNNSALVQFPTGVLLLLITFLLQRRKIGFHFTVQDSLRGYNFYLSAVLIIAVVMFQLTTLSLTSNLFNILIPIIFGLIMVTAIYLSYKHNTKLWKERRARLEKRKGE
ncbi:hypothetical protein [Paenibacillus puerhi]|uniref:hypothetical protein n=1 Tax=Paenibacillus puerhi TaxID=2692622 RepID=UPI00135C4735|nr:hypothetical protein [Paenibacillus puerhi]